jgi:hypothetical protein
MTRVIALQTCTMESMTAEARKSLIAMAIVALSLIGFIGGVAFVMTHRWPNNAIRAEFQSVRSSDVSKVTISGSDIAHVEISDEEKISHLIDAFRQTVNEKQSNGERTDNIEFAFKDNRKPLSLSFSRGTVDNNFGPAVAKVLNPYLH